jgi:hypothetical protein
MILFKKQWDEFPTAIADYSTKNESFLKYCEILDAMGIENNAWPLQLFQPELAGIDVHKDGNDLDFETKTKIYLECEYNPFYFLREILLIPAVSSIQHPHFQANRGNMALFWGFLNRIDCMLIQIRQTGKSVGADSLSMWVQLFAARNLKQQLITKDNQLRVENILRYRTIRGLLPKWLVFDDKNDAANQTLFTYNSRGNKILTAVGQNSEDAASNVGRGITSAFLHSDEAPFTPYIWLMLQAAIASGSVAREHAIANNQPSGTLFTTTAGKIDSKSGAYMYRYYKNATRFDEKFMDMEDAHDLQQLVKFNRSGEKKAANLLLLEYDHLQLGKTDEWLEEKIIETQVSGDEADRDFHNRWTAGGISSPLSTSVLEAILASERSPDFVEITKWRYIIEWYITEKELGSVKSEIPFLLGVDTSDAIGRDNIDINITNPYTLKVAATARINYSSLLSAATFVAKLLVILPKSVMIIEKKSSAMTFIDAAIAELVKIGEDPFKRLFNRVIENEGKYKSIMSELKQTPVSRRDVTFYERYREFFGFNTTGSSRDFLFGTVFSTMAGKVQHHIYDKVLSMQLRQLVIKNGRIDHAASGHDDAVFAWLLNGWFIMCGKNLSNYGIDALRIPTRIAEDGFVGTTVDIRKQQRQNLLKEKLNDIIERLNSTQNPFIMYKLESSIEQVLDKLEVTDEESGTLSNMFESIKVEKKRNKLIAKYIKKEGNSND